MPTLRDLIDALRARPDAAGAVVLGRDGLVVDAGHGGLTTAVLEVEHGLAVVSVLSPDVLLVVRLAPDADPGALVYELRRHRARLSALV
jgi:predicted regulator of Ras-like GTPase activity (Roadblock/LC7/MglB family)